MVCDGFVGNVALKTSEGLAQMLASFLRQEFKRNLLTKLAALVAMPALNRFKRRGTIDGTTGRVSRSQGDLDQEHWRLMPSPSRMPLRAQDAAERTASWIGLPSVLRGWLECQSEGGGVKYCGLPEPEFSARPPIGNPRLGGSRYRHR